MCVRLGRALRALLGEPPPDAAFRRQRHYPWMVVGTVCVGAFMGQLDASIVSLLLPTLEVRFHSPLRDVQWVGISYLLLLVGLLVPVGHLADRWGRKSLYTAGFLVFSLGSALSGAALNLGMLIAARAVQGAGAALMQANSVAIVTAAVPSRDVGRAIGVQGAAQAIGLAVGPALGGLLIVWLGWRSVFLVNVPVGVLGVWLARRILPQSRTSHTERASLNWVGSLLLPAGAATLLLGLTFLRSAAWLLPLAAVLIGLFAYSEKHTTAPLIADAVWRARGLPAGITTAGLSYTVLFGVLLAVPLMLERLFGAGPERAGLLLAIVPAVLGVAAEIGGWLQDRIGARGPTVAGMALSAAGLACLWAASHGGFDLLIAGLGLCGLGAGLFIPANNASVMVAAPPAHLGVVGGLVNMMRSIGASLGLASVSLVMLIALGPVPTHTAPATEVAAGFRSLLLVLIAVAVVAGALSFVRRSGYGVQGE
jgi:EmrB/QacA subfamily drug resistance transporter